ncbi:kinesin-like protein [Achlya hypogyna]|uniref:Kinesin-like protein n=1 Tax=Achlya hypogyna TaxID=1202772 RepID=A0A1V9YDN9_ACHHY|nr:kinesin-like protein [Achlya hypogyna]
MGDGHDELETEVQLTLATIQGQGQGTEEDKAMTEALLEGATRVSIATILRRRGSIGDHTEATPLASMTSPDLCKQLDFSDTTSEFSEVSWATDDSFATSATTEDVKASPTAADGTKTVRKTSRIGTVRGASSAIPVRDTNASRSRAASSTARAAATAATAKAREQRQSLPVGTTRTSLLRAPTAIAPPPTVSARAAPPTALPTAVPRSASVRARTVTKASPKGTAKRGSIAAAVDLAFAAKEPAPAPAKTPSARQPRLSLPSRLVPPSVVLTEPPPPVVPPTPPPAAVASPLPRSRSFSAGNETDVSTVLHAYKTIFTTEKEIEEALASVVPRSMDPKVRIEAQDKYIRRLKCRLRDLHMQKDSFAQTCQAIERDLTNVHAEAALRVDEPKAGEPSGPEAPPTLDDDPLLRTLDSSMQEFVRAAMERNTQNIVAKYQAQWLDKEKAHELHLQQLREHYTAQVSKVTQDAWATVATQASQRKALEAEKVQLELQWTQLQIDHSAVQKELHDLQEKWRIQDEENTSAKTFWQKSTDMIKENRRLTEDIVHVTSQLAKANEVIAAKDKDVVALQEAVSAMEAKLAQVDAERHAWTDQVTSLKATVAEEKSRREHFQLAQDQLASDNTALYAQMVAVQTGCEARLEEMKAAYEKKMHSVAEEMRMLQTENRVLSRVSTSEAIHRRDASLPAPAPAGAVVDDSEFKKLTEDFFEVRTQLAAQTALVADLERQVHEGNILRRAMHNTIQELRGNVRVHVRLRPFLPSDGDYEKLKSSWVVDEDASTIVSSAKQMRFSFDKLFGQTHGQEQVFNEVADFIQSAIDGYHVCIFAYGQTGSGKTYTMQGGRRPEMRGIIPRSMNLIMGCCATLLEQGWDYTLEVTYMEIYNETIRDLLGDAPLKYTIRTDKAGKNYVENLLRYPISLTDGRGLDQIEDIMERAASNRSVEKTDMNAESSRSHSIFTLHLRGAKREEDGSEVELVGSLSLVDLAGSERLSRSGATGDRLKEAQAINKSLSSLADVFSAIAKKQNHIPYRNSKLTYVLQPALSGDGKTLMMVNLSPTDASVDESVCSLRFAQQVNQCELGAAGRQVTKREAKAAPVEMDINAPVTPPKGKAPRLSLNATTFKAPRKPTTGRAIDAS